MRVRVFALLVLSAAAALAQVGTSRPSSALPPTSELPGLSIGGPDIMTRTGRFGSIPGTAEQGFTYFGTVNGVYDTGRILQIPDAEGNVPGGAFGVEGGGGMSLNKIFRHSTLLLSYNGTYRTYNAKTFNNGWNQALSLTYGLQLSRRLSMTFSGQGGMTMRNGYFNSGSFVPGQEGAPDTLPIDTSTRFFNTGVTLSYQHTARWYYQIGGDFFTTRYASSSLGTNVGQRLSFSANYRWSSRTTLSATYAYNRYEFRGRFGTGNTHTVMGGVSHRFSPLWEAGFNAGVSRTSTDGLGFTRFIVDPVTGKIIGDPTSIEVFSRVRTFPAFDGRLSRNFHHGGVSVFGGQRVSSGNGAYLTSKVRNIGIAASRRMSDRLGVDGSFYWSQMSSLSTTLSNTGSFGMGAGANYRLNRMFGLRARYDFYHYSNRSFAGRNNNSRVLFGITLSPRMVPLF